MDVQSKKVVDWIGNEDMQCILNMFHDGSTGNWLHEGIKAKKNLLVCGHKLQKNLNFMINT